ncbi:MAG: hypothetical protein J6K58_10960 [Lachnospiraceae bacterium]|nr:hypothetical protein [Lachnospiraceae bacterium]
MNKSDCEENALNSRNCSKIVVPKITEKADVFHYTSSMGLKDILHKGSLWFTNIKYLNDKSEIIDGIKSSLKLIEIEQGILPESIEKEIKLFLENLEREIIKRVLDKNVFVCCFSKGWDELPLWNYYTKDLMNQGYNIGFSCTKLVQTILDKNEKELNGCELSFGNISYDENLKNKYWMRMMRDFYMQKEDDIKPIMKIFANELISIGRDKIDSTDEEIQRLLDIEINSKFEETKKIEGHLPPIYSYCREKNKFCQSIDLDPTPYYKRKDFKSEKEIRIVITVPDKNLKELKEAGIYKFRISKNVLVPYLELKFDKRAISGITISPTIQSDLIKTSLEEYCEYCDIDSHKLKLGIRNSDIPVRF